MSLMLSQDAPADALLDRDPLALLIAMLLDQQVPMEWAFRGPFELKQRLGGRLDADEIAAMDVDKLRAVFSDKPALHRYPGSMAERVHALARYIVDEYGGDAGRIWADATTGADLLARLQALPGYGKQKAQIFVAILSKRLAVAPTGWEQAAGDYGAPGYRSVADVDGPGALAQVREYKRAVKAKAKGAKSGV